MAQIGLELLNLQSNDNKKKAKNFKKIWSRTKREKFKKMKLSFTQGRGWEKYKYN